MQTFNSRSDLYKSARQESAIAPAQDVPARFFITLCPVLAPVTVPQPKSPALQRFRFFFARETDAGRTRYWLQFGYFATEHEAMKWRDVLGRVYPAAVIRKRAETDPAPDILSESQVLAVLTVGAPDTRAAEARPQKASVPAPAGTSGRKSSSLEDTLNELRDSALGSFEPDDDVSSTGVRHLHVQVERRARNRKPSK